jgi:acyl-homoserine-lactone acylase
MHGGFQMRTAFCLLTALLVAACSRQQPPVAAPQNQAQVPLGVLVEHVRQDTQAANVTIIRDKFGVPHIYGKSDADAVFGLLYAQSEDDFPRLERNYIWALGRLAEIEGEAALYSDLRARLYMTEIEARERYVSAPGWLKALCIAFADGVNFYLRTHPQVTPALITHFEPWMPLYFFEGSIGGDIEQIPLAGIKAFYGARTTGNAGYPPEQVNASAPRLTYRAAIDDDEPRGSNGIAIAGALTDSGSPLLLINPHTSFYFRGEVHVVSEEGLNVYGAVTWGQFFVYQGFNEHTGWMHTSTYADFIDEFVEEIVEREGRLFYRYGDRLRPVSVSDVTLKFRDGEKLSERSFPMYHTHHGPITHELDGRWVATRINWDPVNALRQSFLRTRQSNYEEFLEVMRIRTNSSNNTVYADSSGNIAYFHGNFIPRRDARFDFSEPVDGSDPTTDWQAPHPVEETITLLNPANGWIQNCNSTPFTAADNYSPDPDNYPAYMAPDPENFRAVHAVRLLRDIATGQAGKLSIDELIALAYHPQLPAFEVLIPGLLHAWDSAGQKPTELATALTLLRDWDYSVSADSVAMTLAHFYGLQVREKGGAPTGASRKEIIEYFASEAPPVQQLSLFAEALSTLSDNFGSWDIAWGEVNRYQRLDGEIAPHFDDAQPSLAVGMASGRWGALASYGSRAWPGTQKLYGTSGNSFVAVVEFGERVRAKTLLAGGQSGDPDSPHFADQTRAYIDHQFKEAAFYRKDVSAQAQHTYQPGSR